MAQLDSAAERTTPTPALPQLGAGQSHMRKYALKSPPQHGGGQGGEAALRRETVIARFPHPNPPHVGGGGIMLHRAYAIAPQLGEGDCMVNVCACYDIAGGSSKVMVVPRPGWVTTRICPLCSSISALVMARPRPTPSWRCVVWAARCA